MSDTAEFFIRRCITLAKKGINRVAPNPMVGCVITVPDGNQPFGERIIGEGYHKEYGGPHAEVNAIASVKDTRLLKTATAYVSLEPCSHHGKTPPCADLLINSGVGKVVAAMEDPNPRVSGNGLARLSAAGVSVSVNVLQTEASTLNTRFMTAQALKRPFVLLKWAQTPLGYINDGHGNPIWISNRRSQQIVHQWRSEEQAIMVGANTAIIDDPSLTTRSWAGASPKRVLMDAQLRTPEDNRLLSDGLDTLVYNNMKKGNKGSVDYRNIDPKNLKAVLHDLYTQNIHSILVEGGSQLLSSFIEKNLWDEARVITGNVETHGGTKAPQIQFLPHHTQQIEHDTIQYFKNPQL